MTAAKVRNNSYNGRGVGGGGERSRSRGGRGFDIPLPLSIFFRRTSEQHTATNHVI